MNPSDSPAASPTTPGLTREQMDQLAPEIAKQVLEQFRAAGARGEAPFGLQAKAAEPTREERLLRFSKFIACCGGLNRNAPLREVQERFGRVPEFAAIAKGMQESVFTTGGAMLIPQFSADIVELLRPESILLQLGSRVENFKGEEIIRKRTGGVTMYWVSEGAEGTKSTPAFGQVKLQPKKGMVLADVSNDLLRNPDAGDLDLAQDIIEEVASKTDLAGINGKGAAGEPTGVIQFAVTNTFARAGTSVANFISDLDLCVKKVLDANIPIAPGSNPGWALSPTMEATLLGLRDTAGFVFRDEMLARRTIRGFPYRVSTNVPSSKIIFGLWRHHLYGIDTALVLSQHPDSRATYDETLVRGVIRVDFQVRHEKAFSVITGY